MKKLKLYIIFYLLGMFLVMGCSGESVENIPEKEVEEKPEETDGMVLGEKTKRLTHDFINHVSSCVTEMQITLDSATPQSLLPQSGDILLNTETSEKFPYGFLGKVARVEKTGDGFLIEAERAYLNEAFEKLYVEGDMEIEVEQQPENRSPSWEIPFGIYEDGDYKGITIGYTLTNLRNCSEDSYLSTILNSGFYFQYIIDIDNKIKKPYASFTLKHRYNLSTEMNVNYSHESDDKIYNTELTRLSFVPKVGAGAIASIILRPEMVISVVAKAKGEINMNTSLDFLLESVAGVVYKDGKWDMGWHPIPQNSHLKETLKFDLKGSLFFGLRCDFRAKLFSENLFSLKIPFDIGASVSAEISEELIASSDYEFLSNAEAIFGIPAISAEGKFEMFKDAGYYIEGNVPIFEKNLLEKKVHLFPKFNNLTAAFDEEDGTKADVSSRVTQDLLIPVEIDYEFSSSGEKYMNEYSWTKYHSEDDIDGRFTKTVKGLDPALEYKVTPVIKFPIWGKIRATPEVTLEREHDVLTMGNLYNEPTLMLAGAFDVEKCNPSSFGICYSISNDTPTISDNKQYASIADEGDFEIIIPDAKKNVIYYYRAFIVIGDKICYGETETASTYEPSEGDLRNIIGSWERVSYNMKPYVPKDDEDKYGRIPCWEVITFMKFDSNHGHSAYYDLVGMLHGYWRLLSNTQLYCHVEGIGEEGDSLFTIKELTQDTMWLQVRIPGLYKMDAVFKKIK